MDPQVFVNSSTASIKKKKKLIIYVRGKCLGWLPTNPPPPPSLSKRKRRKKCTKLKILTNGDGWDFG